MDIDFEHQTRQWLGLYEIEIDRHLRRLLQPGMTAFDVGAQHGYDALAIAKRTGARVAAFECDPEYVLLMQGSFDLNPVLAPLIEPVLAFVGDEPGHLSLDEWAYSSEGFLPDFVKIDIEGGEVEALQSAHRLLIEQRPALIVEVHSVQLEQRAGALLVAHGYQPLIVSQRKVLPDWRPLAHNRWLVAAKPPHSG
jgi:hypothetical protein